MRKKFYYTDHFISQSVRDIFCKGFDLEPIHIKNINENLCEGFLYGALRGCFDGMKLLRKNNLNYYYVDHPFLPVKNEKYFRVCKNSRFFNFELKDLDDKRIKKINLKIEEKKKRGDKILLFVPSPFVCMYNNLNQVQWTKEVYKKIKKYTDREVIISKKTDNNSLEELFSEVHVLVHYASMGAFEALIRGIPVVTLGNFFLEKYYNNSIENIENVKICDRNLLYKILCNLSYSQYSTEEIESGKAKEIIKETLGEYND